MPRCGLKNLRRTRPIMPNSIEDILEPTKLGRMVREVSAHLVPFGHYTTPLPAAEVA
jgi:hypothetical protein